MKYSHGIALTGLLLLLACYFSFGQVIRGVVLDQTNQQPVPFVTIYSPTTGAGTLSNENGDFELTVNAFPARVVVSHISFQTDTITFTQPTADYKIRLKPSIRELATVTVSNAGYKLIQQAFERVKSNKSTTFNKAFYRQVTKNGEQPTEIQEVMYNVKLSSSKIEGSQIVNARYAKMPTDSLKMYFTFVNFSYLVLGQKSISELKPSKSLLLFPMRYDVADYYTVQITDLIEQANGEKVAELDCRIREDYVNAAFSGKVYINTTTLALVKMQGTTKNSLEAAINNSKTLTDNHVYSFDINYITQPSGTFFSSIRVMVEFDQLIKATGEKRKDQVTAFLLVNGSLDVPAKAPFKSVDVHRDDLKLIKRAKYNPEFWRNNPVVRRTPLEEATIRAFEQQGVMGNMKFDDR